MRSDTLRKTIEASIVALFCVVVVGCATIQESTVSSKASYNTIWRACIDSLSDVRYSASSTDKTSGIIIADQAVFQGQGTVSRLNIMLEKTTSGVSVKVKFVPPPGTMGGGGTADSYIKALKKRIPDIQVAG
jgi:hypothetical protein